MEASCQPARKPLAGWGLPEGKRATLTRRPLPFPFVMCQECFFLMLCFCDYCACYGCSSSCSSPVYGFSGRPLAGRAVVNGASGAVSALRASIPDAKPLACSDHSGRAASVAPWPALPASRQQDAGM
ncbi:hypothetical protein ABGM23_004690 [Escherichia albertii]|uniref:hypothetical protein n=1 Tax=Escherichia albertii TaxID=208962 RepID=UPI0021D454B5|nr:hypothetical protein [Escherichia albertii]MCU7272911.1 hypothetical protein [Escherichia albertii]WDB45705.1 hypothetical protein PS031_23280 [Escherichia albertii]